MNANLPPAKCPGCSELVDDATAINGPDRRPAPGDVTVCAYCTSFCIFTDDLQLRLLTMQEISELDDEARNTMVRARRAIQNNPPRLSKEQIKDHVTTVCKIGKGEKCCRYIARGLDGMRCLKIDPPMKALIDRRADQMNSRGDNCAGRKLS